MKSTDAMSETQRALNEGSDALRNETREALDDGAAKLRKLNLSRPARALTPLLLKALKQRDYATAMTSINRARQDLARIGEVLDEIYERVQQAEREDAATDPLGNAWWNQRCRNLEDVRGDPAAWMTLWARSWVEALAARRFDRCDQISAVAGPELDEIPRIRDTMRVIFAALSADRPAEALPALDWLLDDSTLNLPDDTTVQLAVLRTRIYLRHTRDIHAAQRYADTDLRPATEKDPSSDQKTSVALALTALAEVRLKLGETEEVRQLLNRALTKSADFTDALIVAGMLAEYESAWHRALKRYDTAVASSGGEVCEARLLRPVPATLVWRYAQRIKTEDPKRALEAIELALQSETLGHDPFPLRRALVDKARILEDLGQLPDAAATYAEAGNQYVWSGAEKRGLSFLRNACELAPDVAEYHWAYAEALRGQATDVDDIADMNTMRRAESALGKGAVSRNARCRPRVGTGYRGPYRRQFARQH
jgi:hypothetical protein